MKTTRFRRRPPAGAIVAALAIATLTARGAPAEATAPPEQPSSKREVADALRGVRDQYGIDAVRLQSHLLQHALEGGSILAASVGVRGIEEHRGRKFLVVELETGIVYDDDSVAAARQPARIWREVVHPTLSEFSSIDLPAEGLTLRVSYQHARYRDRDEILRRAAESPPPAETLVLHLTEADVVDLALSRAPAAQVLEHADVTLGGKPVRIAPDD